MNIAGTEDGTDILVEGCTQTALKSGIETVLNAKDGKIILKGKITYLVCRGNQLTSLNVQGLTQFQKLECFDNQLDTAAFTSILNALPARNSDDNANCYLFEYVRNEQNYKFTDPVPDDLKTAFKAARDRKHWSLKKVVNLLWRNTQDITLP